MTIVRVYRGTQKLPDRPALQQVSIPPVVAVRNKIIMTIGGGMLVSLRSDWIERARFFSTQARDNAPHYRHSESGYSYRMSNLLAAVGRG